MDEQRKAVEEVARCFRAIQEEAGGGFRCFADSELPVSPRDVVTSLRVIVEHAQRGIAAMQSCDWSSRGG